MVVVPGVWVSTINVAENVPFSLDGVVVIVRWVPKWREMDFKSEKPEPQIKTGVPSKPKNGFNWVI
ncbi:MAG: hypothetical protein AB1595_07475 [bacterium]